MEGGFHTFFEASRLGDLFGDSPLIEVKGLARETSWFRDFGVKVLFFEIVLERLNGSEIVGFTTARNTDGGLGWEFTNFVFAGALNIASLEQDEADKEGVRIVVPLAHYDGGSLLVGADESIGFEEKVAKDLSTSVFGEALSYDLARSGAVRANPVVE